MQLTFIAATPFEIEPLRAYLAEHFTSKTPWIFTKGEHRIEIIISGVGMTATAFALGQYLALVETHLLINAGVAGAFNRDLKLGDVVMVSADRYGDLGVEEANGNFTDMHELDLIPADEAPFSGGWLPNPGVKDYDFLPKVTGMTVQRVHGYAPSIVAATKKYSVDIETMEGAAVHYAALIRKVPFLQIRGISNYVEARDRENWELGLAIEKLNAVLVEMVGGLVGADNSSNSSFLSS